MPSFVINDLITRARVYVDDDHKEVNGWIDPTAWLAWFNVEYAKLYAKWVRMGLVRPKPTDTPFANTATTNLTGVLAVIGVGEDMGNYVRFLTPAQAGGGPDPFWFGSSPFTSKAIQWDAHGTADDLLIEVNPPDTSSTYIVRWIPTVAYVTDPTTSINLPYRGDEVLVGAMARHALVKESAASRQLDMLMAEAEAELAFTAFGRVPGGPKVRRVPRSPRVFPQRFSTFPTDQRDWYFV